jgi:hypothetical protein
MATRTVVRSQCERNRCIVTKNGKVRAIRAIRVPTPSGIDVAIVVTPDWKPRYALPNDRVFDSAEAAAASLTPVRGFVVRIGPAPRSTAGRWRSFMRAEPVVLRGDGNYMPIQNDGLWCSAHASRAQARVRGAASRTS